LDAEVQAGRFRDDLFFRLMVARVELPPLRERPVDVPLLARAFWEEHHGDGTIPEELLDEWKTSLWPGNARELHNAVARLAALGDVSLSSAPRSSPDPVERGDTIERVLAQKLTLGVAREAVLRDFERRYVAKIVADHGGNVTRAAHAAGVAHRYFQILRAKLDK
jgi:DNA-binding NtrC family response regulator